MRLPLVDPVPAVPDPAPEAAAAAPLAGCVLAVVEDDRVAREALCEWLEESGACVAQGASVRQVQDCLRAWGRPPDCVLADFRLGRSDGLEAIAALRREYGPIPALLISGEPNLAAKGLPVPVLEKPVTPERLLEALKGAIPHCTGGEADSRSRIETPARANA
jgi:CheY-like chemotaxis protein